MKIKRYYIIEHKGHTINITRSMLSLGPIPILWCNDGMYAIIPGAILEELFENGSDSSMTCRIWWEEAYELPQDIGRLLCDKSYNQSSDNHN